MSTAWFIRAALTALAACVCMLLLKKDNPAAAMAVAAAFVLSAAALLLPSAESLRAEAESLLHMGELDGQLYRPVGRVLIISIATKIVCELCREAGAPSAAAALEICGAAASLTCALPLIRQVLTLIGGLT